MAIKINSAIATKSPCYKANKKITVKGLMIHSVGCPQPKASVFLNIWNDANYKNACVHGVIDANDGEIYQVLPWDHRGWHCGSGTKGSGNNTHIGVEMCEPSQIKYTSGANFTCSDVTSARAAAKRTYDSAVKLFAYLCETYKLDPLADGVVISHNEGHSRGIATGHADPEHLWKQLQLGYTMDGFRKDIKAAMTSTPEPSTPDPEPNPEPEPSPSVATTKYRVQCGSYKVKANADKLCAKLVGYGFAVSVEKSDNLYKVLSKEYAKKSSAQSLVTKLAAKGYNSVIITVKVSPEPVITATYVVQCGAYKTKSSADTYCKKLVAEGFDVHVDKIGTMYKVMSAEFTKKSDAESFITRMKAKGHDTLLIYNK